MDEIVPPVVRDSRWFMFPFFCLAYRKLDPSREMEFKSRVWTMTPSEYESFYSNLNSVSRNRLTDLNKECVKRILESTRDQQSVLDVGCGRGYMIQKIQATFPSIECFACDVIDNPCLPQGIEFRKGHADSLPFKDESVDVVFCSHVLEHVKDPRAVVGELLRVARRKLILVTPKQRPYFYTLDEHLNFYWYEEALTSLFTPSTCHCTEVDGDWYLTVQK